MPDDYFSDDPKTLWMELSTNPLQIAPDQLRKDVEQLRADTRRKAIWRGRAALFLVVAYALCFFFIPNPVQRLGSILSVTSAVYLIVKLRIRPLRTIEDGGETSCIQFYRAELERERDFHGWPRVVMFLPGVLLFLAGFAQTHPEQAPVIWVECAIVLILAIVSILWNLRLVRRHQRRIDALDNSLKENGK